MPEASVSARMALPLGFAHLFAGLCSLRFRYPTLASICSQLAFFTLSCLALTSVRTQRAGALLVRAFSADRLTHSRAKKSERQLPRPFSDFCTLPKLV